MQIVNKFMMFNMSVSDMPKAKDFYTDKLGLEITTDYRKDDDNWWVSLTFPEGGTAITLSTYHSKQEPGRMNMYFATSDVEAARKELSDRGVEVGDVQDDLYGPGSGTKYLKFEDPDGNILLLVQE